MNPLLFDFEGGLAASVKKSQDYDDLEWDEVWPKKPAQNCVEVASICKEILVGHLPPISRYHRPAVDKN